MARLETPSLQFSLESSIKTEEKTAPQMSSEPAQQHFVPWTKDLYRTHIWPLMLGGTFSFILFGVTVHQFLGIFRLIDERGMKYSKSWWILMSLFWINLGDTFGFPSLLCTCIDSLEMESVNKYILFIQNMDATRIGPVFLVGHAAPATRACLSSIRSIGVPKSSHTREFCHQLVGFLTFAKITIKPIPEWFPGLKVSGVLALACASAVDVILCACMVYHLRQHKGQTDFQQTSMTATRYIKLTLETGLIPTIGQITELVLIIVKSHTGLWAGFGYTLAKVYVVAVLVLYEAALSGGPGYSSHSYQREKNKQGSGEISSRRFHNQILVTESSTRQEEVVEQPVQLHNIPRPSSLSQKNDHSQESRDS
ncbi:hypothetical protein BT69DRAFT_1316401 [Atractiella rhizophila]|nr:hypothetical protein BT69DRAFT_1316401 [Atractiella rhizophila]